MSPSLFQTNSRRSFVNCRFKYIITRTLCLCHHCVRCIVSLVDHAHMIRPKRCPRWSCWEVISDITSDLASKWHAMPLMNFGFKIESFSTPARLNPRSIVMCFSLPISTNALLLMMTLMGLTMVITYYNVPLTSSYQYFLEYIIMQSYTWCPSATTNRCHNGTDYMVTPIHF